MLKKALARLPEGHLYYKAVERYLAPRAPRGGIDPASYAPDARARALIRGKRVIEADLTEAGGAYDPEQVRELLHGISAEALSERVRVGSVLAVPGPDDGLRYPTVQFGPDGLLPGLGKVRDALPTRNAWAVLNFLVNADDRLGGRKPIDVLREGDIEAVVSAARNMGLQGG